jgi:hypothetical protein
MEHLLLQTGFSNLERSGHSSRLGHTDTHTDTLDDGNSRSFHRNDLLKIGDTLKIENLTLKMKISFDEILPPGVPLNAGTQNS